MANKDTPRSYPPVVEKLVPALLALLAIVMVTMIVASLLVVLGVFR